MNIWQLDKLVNYIFKFKNDSGEVSGVKHILEDGVIIRLSELSDHELHIFNKGSSHKVTRTESGCNIAFSDNTVYEIGPLDEH